MGFASKQALNERLLDAVHHLNYPRYDRDLDVAYFEPRDITENANFLDGLARDIRNGRRTFEGYLFDSTAPISQEDREQFIDSLITKLSTATPSPDRTGRPLFLEGHKLHALSLEFDIIPCIIHPGTILATRSIDDLRQKTASELNVTDAENAASTRCLAHALYARYLVGQELDCLDEAIWWFREAVEATPEEHYSYLDIIVSLCSSLHLRVQLLGLEDDRDSLLEILKMERKVNHAVVLQWAKDLVN
ncbi:hypothetical protein HYPSUDRAFT_64694 [Hypholoma sublateritium FD-334 SS-4]|uniref:Uncharacterized protein n=1 Tax=Hypholoma sublateritium (strain FD-334 SS-4) TaxID=945553 RepID=A0A0D2LDK8_HYPSF|nr:hypothetical protein HYPSUDRAFT_64694 [Hypholoma sublateritium FD-334 SS-4]